MTQTVQNATRLYLEGIRDGNFREAVARYTGDRYIQHSSGVRDGAEGFIEFFEPFIARNPVRDIRIVRALADGRFVFLHVFQDLNNGESRWVTMDMFDTDEDERIVEHWDVIAPYVEVPVSGHTQIDGPTKVTEVARTAQNKAVVRRFLDDVLQNRNLDRAAEYISRGAYVEHSVPLADGFEGIATLMRSYESPGRPRYTDIFKVIGQGNFVVGYSKVAFGDTGYAVFDLFRLENGLIVEHWDAAEEIAPEEEWANSGKF